MIRSNSKLRAIGLAAFLSMSCGTGSVHAVTVAGVDMPDTATVESKQLALNGVGVRKATFLKVKVYVMGLYLENKNSDARSIIESKQDKQIVMHFVHDVTADELRNGWKEGFEKNYPNVKAVQAGIDQFQASMSDAKKGDSIVLDFIGERVDVIINDEKKASISGGDFQQALLSIWLGDHPPNPELKQGVLGG